MDRRKREMFDTIKHLGDVSDDREELRKHIFSTYFWLRFGMLLIALAFPFLLWLVGWVVYGLSLQDSMSAYYWAPLEKGEEGGDAPMRVWFVGLLFALGSCLFLYKGYTRLEDWVLNVAAVCAICVALFPMCWETACSGGSWHGFFAFSFFFLLMIVAVLNLAYTAGWVRSGARRRPSKYYKWAYGFTAAVMILAPIGTWILFETHPQKAFWAEVAGISAFCLFWGVQIYQISKSGFDQELAQSNIRVVADSLKRSLGLSPDLLDDLEGALRSGDNARINEATSAFVAAACDSYNQGHGETH